MKENKTKNEISRKDAITKISRYTAMTALATFMILNPQKAQAASRPPDPNQGPVF